MVSLLIRWGGQRHANPRHGQRYRAIEYIGRSRAIVARCFAGDCRYLFGLGRSEQANVVTIDGAAQRVFRHDRIPQEYCSSQGSKFGTAAPLAVEVFAPSC
jgi:hypothetical protein